MSEKEKKTAAPFPAKGVWVCVDRYGNYDMAGRLYSIASGWGKEFENVADLLLKTDTLLDRQKLPQAFQEKRSFQKKSREEKSREETGRAAERTEPERLPKEEVLEQRGRYGTYNIGIESRMNTNWQGFVRDEDGKLVGIFESELELLNILLRKSKTRGNA